ncbi:MAG: peptidase M2 family protein [Gammaproteobacteria bacterium]|nr:MAG: peptidase M2 family protein [Gammaproteobacteria bacterium]
MKIYLILLFTLTLGLSHCNNIKAEEPPTKEQARQFVDKVEAESAELKEQASRVFWVQANFITDDTNAMAAEMGMKITLKAIQQAIDASAYNSVELDPVLRRKFEQIKLAINLPAPRDQADLMELATIMGTMGTMFATGEDPKGRDLGQLEQLFLSSRDPDELLEAWQGWRTISPAMKDDYARMVEIANKGAAELGYSDMGAMWQSKYDMPAAQFRDETDQLWFQVKPLYDALHCHVRRRLNDKYGNEIVPKDGPIPAHLLGNMWAQSWGNIYDLVAPDDSNIGYNLTERLVAKNYDPIKMMKTGEQFYTSLGFDPLPETFWQRSLLSKPKDRDVQCHATAWNIDGKDDVRIKMCTRINAEDFSTVHHELGHNMYERAFQNQSYLHRSYANDGFDEAIGDVIALSITPKYLKSIGLIDNIPGPEGDVGLLMRQALDSVAFLPFGLLVDKWRWQVFSGELSAENYNKGWWQLRENYQGIKAPVERSADDFDPGAKFHIPDNMPYMRYFLARILQFQFHKAACEIAEDDGPLHRCTIYGNKEVGKRFNAMLEMGASKPWPDTLEVFTGQREMDASAILEYFAPLKQWLDKQNENQSCGW